jgi:hypothetical protein
MNSTLVTIGRRQYVSGLYWENSPSGRIAQAAREAARQPGSQAEFFAARAGNKTGRVPQFGLTQAGGPFKIAQPVLAACLANQQPGSWAGAFRLREGTVVIIVRDDLIVPDGDLFFLDETEARDRLLQEMALGGLQRVYAPETWGVSGADSLPVSLLLNDRTDVRLRPVALSEKTKIFMACGLLLLVGLLGFGWYIQEESAQEEAERLERLQAIERAKAEARKLVPGYVKAPEYPSPERKWEKRPRPLELITACQDTLKKLPMAHAGWKLDIIHCDESGLSEKWTRTGGFSAPISGSVVSDNGGSSAVSAPLPALTPRGPENLVDPVDITKRYLEQNWTGTIARMPDDPPPPPPPDYKGTWNPPPTPWVKRSFTVGAPALPWTLPTFFGDLPGVVVSGLSFNASGSNGSWSIDGVIYENRR